MPVQIHLWISVYLVDWGSRALFYTLHIFDCSSLILQNTIFPDSILLMIQFGFSQAIDVISRWCARWGCNPHGWLCYTNHVNTLRPRRNEQHFADDIFKRIFFNENVWISIKISLQFVPKGPINNISALVQIMAWRRSGAKPLSEPMMVSLPTHICVTRPQWVIPVYVRECNSHCCGKWIRGGRVFH